MECPKQNHRFVIQNFQKKLNDNEKFALDLTDKIFEKDFG